MRSISSWPLATKLAALVATLLALALASIGLTLWITWQLDGGAAAINEAGRMRMQTYRVALLLRDSPSQVGALAHQFDESLTLLEKGDPVRPLFVPWNAEARAICSGASAMAGVAPSLERAKSTRRCRG